MQSSTLVALRSFVMLICLVAVPLFALVGTDGWPRVWQKIVELRNTHFGGGAAVGTAAPVTTNVPPFVNPPTLTAIAADNTRTVPAGLIQPPDFSGVSPTQNPMPGNASRVAQAGNSAATSPPSSNGTPPLPAFWPADSVVRQATAIVPQASQGAKEASPASYNAPLAQSLSPPNAAASGNPIDQIQQRLQALGALHYRLETAGAQGELFRFRCKMALHTNPNHHRYFEATEADALLAMQQVLQQIESWRSGR